MDPAAAQLFIAHAGHWALYVVYLAPVLIVLVSVVVTVRREKPAQREGTSPPRQEP